VNDGGPSVGAHAISHVLTRPAKSGADEVAGTTRLRPTFCAPARLDGSRERELSRRLHTDHDDAASLSHSPRRTPTPRDRSARDKRSQPTARSPAEVPEPDPSTISPHPGADERCQKNDPLGHAQNYRAKPRLAQLRTSTVWDRGKTWSPKKGRSGRSLRKITMAMIRSASSCTVASSRRIFSRACSLRLPRPLVDLAGCRRVREAARGWPRTRRSCVARDHSVALRRRSWGPRCRPTVPLDPPVVVLVGPLCSSYRRT